MSDKRVVIAVFIMDGCGACHAYVPTVNKLGAKYQSCITTYVIDCNSRQYGPLADKHKITATPTTILFRKNGQIAGRKEGGMSEEELETWYTTALQWSSCEI